MADISKVTLPSGNTYDLSDLVARANAQSAQSAAAAAMAAAEAAEQSAAALIRNMFVIAWDGNDTPVVADIPEGVEVTHSGQTYTGTLAASSDTRGKIYLVAASSGASVEDYFNEFITVTSDVIAYTWEKLGDTRVDLSQLGALATKNSVTLNKGNGVNVLTGATAAAQASQVNITPETAGVGSLITSTAGSLAKSRLVTKEVPNITGVSDVSIPNVTSVGAPSTWAFTVNNGNLTISGANGSAPTLGTAKVASKATIGSTATTRFATGALSTGSTPAADKGAEVATGEVSNTGNDVVTGLVVAERNVITGITSATAAAQNITITPATEKVAKYTDLGVTVQ